MIEQVFTIGRALWDHTHPDYRDGTVEESPRLLRWCGDAGMAFVPVRIVPGVVFPSGRLLFTPAYRAYIGDRVTADEIGYNLVTRHQQGDYGAVSWDAMVGNERALAVGGRVMSAYPVELAGSTALVWVTTAADRSLTTVHHLPAPQDTTGP